MSPEVRHAWLNAGDWVVANWPNLAIGVTAVAIVCAIWRIRPGDDYRSRNDRVAAQRTLRTDPPRETPAPGSNDDLLDACNAIYPDFARKEKPQP
jgi:hypothetical protein